MYPTSTHSISFPFGKKYTFKSGRHKGVDFAVPQGSAVFAARDGVIVHAGKNGVGVTRGWGKAYGIQIIQDFDRFTNGTPGLYGIYAHLSTVTVKRGQRVKVGDLIGHSGNTGSSTGAHLHFEIQKRRYWSGWLGCRNPQPWLEAKS
jgi:murein DD-endopeptidase MepM/ murein hydrolase activator NlpD